MGRSVVVSAVAGLVFGSGLLAGAGVAEAAPAAAGGWGTAIPVPGTAGLNQGGNAQVSSVSCGSPGSCTAVGYYTDQFGDRRPFFVSQVNGKWGTATPLPGVINLTGANGSAAVTSVSCASAGNCTAGGYEASGRGQQAFVDSEHNGFWVFRVADLRGSVTLNAGRVAQVSSVSCASAVDCGAGGFYTDGSGHRQAFVVSRVNGFWRAAAEVSGTAALNAGEDAQVSSVSCRSAGNCTAGGYFTDGAGRQQAFVVREVNGAWGAAAEVRATAALNAGGDAQVSWVSCGSAGNCTAGGYFTDSSGHRQAFVVSRVNGKWAPAAEVPGTGGLNIGGDAQVSSLSCVSAGNCGAGGFYTDGSGKEQAFVVSQVNGKWGTAAEVPGTAALNIGGDAQVSSVSCGSAGNCSAAGTYADGSNHQQTFVVSQVNGKWQTAAQMPGTAALNRGGKAQVSSLSCVSAGNCSAGGFYVDRSGKQQALVVSQVNGKWQTAAAVPGTAGLNAGGAGIASMSCRSAGNCSAGGTYTDAGRQLLVVSQVNGKWRTAIEVPGAAKLNVGGYAEVSSVSCGSAGNCTVGGFYTDRSAGQHAFLVNQVNGTWATAAQVPGTAALNAGDNARVNSVSCSSAGNCTAGGYYADGSGHAQAFVVSQVNGVWGTAVEVPGTAALNVFGSAGVSSVSCGSAGNCSAGGFYADGPNHQQVFVVSQVNGEWGTAAQVPGTAALNTGGNAQISSLSCRSAGNCSAGGFYIDGSNHQQAFAVSQVNGTWRPAIEVPGTAALNAGGNAQILSVSCGSMGNCSAGGFYTDGSNHQQAFVASQVNGKWSTAIEVPGTAVNNLLGSAQISSVSCASAGNCSAGGSYSRGQKAFVVSQVSGKWGTAIQVPGLSNYPDAAINTVSCASAGKCSAGGSYYDINTAGQAFVVSQG